MLKIQVLGRGLIPRGLGLAPRKTPFNADYQLIGTLLNTPGLSLTYKNPEDGRLLPLTRQNVKRVWDKYANWEEKKSATPNTQPHTPEDEGKPGENHEEKKDEGTSVPDAPSPENEPKLEEKEEPAPTEEKKDETSAPAPAPVPEVKVDRPEEEKKPDEKPAEKVEEKVDDAGKSEAPTITTVLPNVGDNKPNVGGPTPIPTVLNNGQKNNQQNNQKRK